MKKNFLIIVESLKGYENYKKTKREKSFYDEIIWASLSGQILKEIKKKGDKCLHLESFINKQDVEIIDYCSKKVSLEIIDLLNKYFFSSQQLSLSNATKQTFSSVVFVVFYRSYILQKIKDNNLYKEIVCVGKKKLLLDNDLYLYFSHFDTLFSLIFYHSKENYKNIIDDSISLEEIKYLIKKKKNFKLSFIEKIISLLEKNLNEIAFKIFEKLNFEKLYNKFIANKKKKPIIIYGENPIISNIFNSIIKNRNKIFLKKRLTLKFSNIEYEQDSYNELLERVVEKINSDLLKNISPLKILIPNFFLPSLKLILTKYFSVFNLIEKNQNELKKIFKRYSKNFHNSIVLTNGFHSIPEKMFYQFYKKKFTNKTIFFSHGITVGINKKSLDNLEESAMKFSDELVFFDFVSYYFYRKLKTNKKIYVSGIPQKNLFFRNFISFLIKKKLNISNKKVIVFVVEAEKNNSNHSSKYENDKTFYENIIKRVKYLQKNYSNYLILLKLYPNQGFFDEYDFDELKKDNENLLILKYWDFRWLVYISDIIFSSTYESTPQHIMQSGCTYYQFEDSNNHITNFIKRSVSDDFYIFKKKWFIKQFDNNLFNKIEKIK